MTVGGPITGCNGVIIAFLGPDGSGKSSVVKALEDTAPRGFTGVDRYHLFPFRKEGDSGAGAAVIDPHRQPPRSYPECVLKLLYLFALYVAGYWLNIRARSRAGRLIVFDRYYHDLLVDPLRYRFGGPMWLARWIGKLIPKPDLWIFLDATAEVLQARKQEVSFDETARQRLAYTELARGLNNSVVVDASQPLDKVVSDVNSAILTFMAERTRKRIGLSSNR